MLMRQVGSRRRHSRAWWGVFLCAVLAMGVYIAFDMLDLDGSSLRDAWPGSAVAAEPVGGEAERALPLTEVTPHAPALGGALAAVCVDRASGSLDRAPTIPRLGGSLRRVLPRVTLARDTSAPASPSADPA